MNDIELNEYSYRMHELVNHIVVLIPFQPRHFAAQICWVFKQARVVGTHVEHHWHDTMRRDAPRSAVQRKLPNGDPNLRRHDENTG